MYATRCDGDLGAELLHSIKRPELQLYFLVLGWPHLPTFVLLSSFSGLHFVFLPSDRYVPFVIL